MKTKKIVALMMAALIVLCAFSSCGCKHEWKDADCLNPKTCSLCEETEGEAAGHKWIDATCTSPKTCKNCDETKGKALGHDWQDATTESPTTCSRCKVTEGKKIDADPRFTTESTKEFYGKWTCETTIPAEMFALDGYIEDIPCTLSYEFKNAGDVIADIELDDYHAFIDAMKAYTKDVLVNTLIAQGVPEAQIDDAMVAAYGMTVEEYVTEAIDSIDMDELFAAFTNEWVYYVGQNGIYMADSWLSEFECSEYTIEDDTLIIENDVIVEGGEPLVWKKVTE